MAIVSAEITPAGYHLMVYQAPYDLTLILILIAFQSPEGFSAGFRRNKIGHICGLRISLAEDAHILQIGKS